MSTDQVMYINRVATNEEILLANGRLPELLGYDFPFHGSVPRIRVVGLEDGWTQTHLWIGCLYFGHEYTDEEWWPTLRTALNALRSLFPNDDVYYGTAGNPEYDDIVDDEFLDDHDALWDEVSADMEDLRPRTSDAGPRDLDEVLKSLGRLIANLDEGLKGPNPQIWAPALEALIDLREGRYPNWGSETKSLLAAELQFRDVANEAIRTEVHARHSG